MGSDPVPFFANLFLYFYESKWMKELKKNDLIKARKLGNIFGFIDDLNSVNDSGEFESNYSNIHPEELQLGKENSDKHEASFLDLNIKIKHGKFHFGFFDKRDSFATRLHIHMYICTTVFSKINCYEQIYCIMVLFSK